MKANDKFHLVIDIVKQTTGTASISISLNDLLISSWLEPMHTKELEVVWPDGSLAHSKDERVLNKQGDKRKQTWKPIGETSAKVIESHPLTDTNTLIAIVSDKLSKKVKEIRAHLYKQASASPQSQSRKHRNRNS